MTRTAAYYTDHALDALNAGFTSKSGQKDAIDHLNRAYQMAKDEISNQLLADRSIANWDDLYWGLPDLHNWKPRHDAAFAGFPAQVEAIKQLVELRGAVKAAPVNSPVRAEKSEFQVRAEKTIKELIEQRQSQYLNAINLGEIFGGLPVSANTHWCVNEHGTEYLRTFYYLAGTFTPLLVIVAAAQELQRREKGK